MLQGFSQKFQLRFSRMWNKFKVLNIYLGILGSDLFLFTVGVLLVLVMSESSPCGNGVKALVWKNYVLLQ